MAKLDHALLALVKMDFAKRAFVPMAGGQTEPVAGASPMTAAMGAPMGDPNAQAGAPPAGAPPMDPAAQGAPAGAPPAGAPPAGAPPVDPATGLPVDPASGQPIDPSTGQPIDPAVLQQMMAQQGGDPSAGQPPMGQIILTPAEFIQIIESIKGSGKSSEAGAPGAAPAEAPKPKSAGTSAKLDQILGLLGGQGAAPVPAAPAPAAPAQ